VVVRLAGLKASKWATVVGLDGIDPGGLQLQATLFSDENECDYDINSQNEHPTINEAEKFKGDKPFFCVEGNHTIRTSWTSGYVAAGCRRVDS
jgi:hypothetical protein